MGHKHGLLELGGDNDIFLPGYRLFNGYLRCQEFSLNRWDSEIMINYLKSWQICASGEVYVHELLPQCKTFFPQSKIT